MIIAVHAVTSRRNTRPRAVTFLGTGKSMIESTQVIDKVHDKVGAAAPLGLYAVTT